MLAQQISIEQESLLQHMSEIEEGRPAVVSGAHVGDIIGLGTLICFFLGDFMHGYLQYFLRLRCVCVCVCVCVDRVQ